MRAIVAAVLLACLGTGCKCPTCCDTPSQTRQWNESPGPTGAAVTSTQPPAPAGVPVGRPVGVGAYGGTGN